VQKNNIPNPLKTLTIQIVNIPRLKNSNKNKQKTRLHAKRSRKLFLKSHCFGIHSIGIQFELFVTEKGKEKNGQIAGNYAKNQEIALYFCG
jgi:ribosomal protein S18